MPASADKPHLRAIQGHRIAPRAPSCALRVYRHTDWTALLIRGELDLDAAKRVTEMAIRELGEGKPLVIELAGLEFIDVNGVRALKRVVAEGAGATPIVPVELHGARGQVADLIDRLGLNDLLEKPGPISLSLLAPSPSRRPAA